MEGEKPGSDNQRRSKRLRRGCEFQEKKVALS